MDTEASGKPVSVAIKAQYTWGDADAHGLGLVTAFTPGFAFVHASAVPPEGVEVRMRLPMVGKFGSVEFRGLVVAIEGAKLQGFGVQIGGFVKGEAALTELLGLPKGSMASAQGGQPLPSLETMQSPAAVKEPGEVTVLIGIQRADAPGQVVDVGETGIYLKVGPGPEGDWQLKQIVRIELSVPMGLGLTRFPMTGRIVRIDPPQAQAGSGPGWGVAVQFREGTALAPEMAKRIQLYLPRRDGVLGAGPALWTEEGFEVSGAGLGGAAEPWRRKVTWTKWTIAAAILMVVAWVIALWLLTEWRLNSILGPPPDPASLPKPP